MTHEEYIAGFELEEHLDPTDPNFRIITMRVPHPPGNTHHTSHTKGAPASRLITRFCAAFLAGGWIPEALGRRIFDLNREQERPDGD